MEPAGRWALVPTLAGVRAVDLVAGRAGRELRLDCLDGALLVGRCRGADSDTAWIVGS